MPSKKVPFLNNKVAREAPDEVTLKKQKPPNKKLKEPDIINKKIAERKAKAESERAKPKSIASNAIPPPSRPKSSAKPKVGPKKQLTDTEVIEAIVKKYEDKNQRLRVLKSALATTRQAKSKLSVQNSRIEQLNKSYFEFDIQWHKMLATAAACLSMFLIGAPLGAIIKRGGLGFPVLVSILFFIIYYVISIGGEKYAKSGMLPVFQGVWMANLILFPIGLFFLRQAKNDARLFEMDYYLVATSNLIDKIKLKFSKKD